jgi:hypothetical protein
MITEDQYISYFEELARTHKQILHQVDGKVSFIEVEDPDDLSAFDEALRSATGDTMMLAIAGEGELDDNDSENHVQTVDVQLYVLKRKLDYVSTSDIRTATIGIIRDILGRTKKDAREQKLIPGKYINFRISKVPVRKIGPVELDWYGHAAYITFSCPFGYTVDSGTWTDK